MNISGKIATFAKPQTVSGNVRIYMNLTINKVFLHFVIAILIAIVYQVLFLLTIYTLNINLFSSMGGLTIFSWCLIVIAHIHFYYLTTYLNFWLTALSLILNEILLAVELWIIYHIQNEINLGNLDILLAGIFWVFNKLLIDKTMVNFELNLTESNRIERIRIVP